MPIWTVLSHLSSFLLPSTVLQNSVTHSKRAWSLVVSGGQQRGSSWLGVWVVISSEGTRGGSRTHWDVGFSLREALHGTGCTCRGWWQDSLVTRSQVCNILL